jgi:adenosylcobinamide-GDP ribazoletransferase
MLSIMKDSHVGVMGVVCLVCILGIKWCGISSIESQRTLILILIPAYARATSLIGFASLPYGRPEGGLGQPFFQESKPVTSFWAFAVLIPISLFLGWKALVLNILFVFLVFSFLFFIHKRLGCLTGDIFGAMIETTEALLFLGMSLIV